MPQLSVDVPHQLDQSEAKRRLIEKIADARATAGTQVTDLEENWNDNEASFAFQVVGMKVAGTMAVEPDQVRVKADLPFAAIMFRGMIEQRVRQEIGDALA